MSLKFFSCFQLIESSLASVCSRSFFSADWKTLRAQLLQGVYLHREARTRLWAESDCTLWNFFGRLLITGQRVIQNMQRVCAKATPSETRDKRCRLRHVLKKTQAASGSAPPYGVFFRKGTLIKSFDGDLWLNCSEDLLQVIATLVLRVMFQQTPSGKRFNMVKI